jgi:hypothetical protein
MSDLMGATPGFDQVINGWRSISGFVLHVCEGRASDASLVGLINQIIALATRDPSLDFSELY